jgi:HNH endonuclease
VERERRGSLRPEVPIRDITREGWLSHGYWCVRVPPELQHLTGGAGGIGEHRLVMSVRLGRPLRADEVVHHRNGDRLDNRPENLELWSTAQPKGQRTEDKLVFAYEMLRRYDPEAVGALGLDLDPATGRPRNAESPPSLTVGSRDST